MIQRAKTEDKEAVFVNSYGEPYKKDGIRKTFESACRRAGITDLRFHDLRPTLLPERLKKAIVWNWWAR